MSDKNERYLSEFWLKRQKEISDSYNGGSLFKDKVIAHSMICQGGLAGGFVAQGGHIIKWEEVTGKSIADVGKVIEFGGGYGLMCKIIQMANRKVEYNMVDLPVAGMLQRKFLQTDCPLLVEPHKMAELPSVFDLFIACHSLNESSNYCIEEVIGREFFGAEHLLIAYPTKDNHVFEFERYVPRIVEMGAKNVYVNDILSYLLK